MKKLAIVVIGYNRTDGLLKLLSSLENAEYDNDKITLIISLDNCGSKEPEQACNNFNWSHGSKIIRTFDQRQGLRNHILSCGEYLQDFDAIAVFEDDLVVSPSYYHFMKSAVDYYSDVDEVAGISLYTHLININCNLPFIPVNEESDVYFMKFAMSWGQIWLKKQWFDFKSWYENNKNTPFNNAITPSTVSNWPETSWLKYHIRYCGEKNKYFVYPYKSFTTCFSYAGTHAKKSSDLYNVPLCQSGAKTFRFCSIDNGIKYDSFFESESLCLVSDLPEEQITIDFYGTKQNYTTRYVLTRKSLPYKILQSFGLHMRPQEINIINNIQGSDIFLYDTNEKSRLIKHNKNDFNCKTIDYYYNISYGTKKILKYAITRIKNHILKLDKK